MTKKLFSFLIVYLVFQTMLFAQTPEKMSFQSVIRNNQNQLVTNTTIGIQISILSETADGNAVYIENQTPRTNGNGLATFVIGDGTILYGELSSINWGNGPFFIKMEIDPNGGTNYHLTTTTQILSVPYALRAKTIDYYNETDPEYNSWDKSTGISISEDQISNLNHFTTDDEKDPTFNEWDKSTGIEIKESQIADLEHFTNKDEKDPTFNVWDKSTGIEIEESQIADLEHFTNKDEKDPVYKSSPAATIGKSDIKKWNNDNSIQDTDNDTRVLAEKNTDEDIIRFETGGNEALTINNNSGTILKLPSNDGNSSFKVKKANGQLVFGVDGQGLLNGDGSGLKNIRPKIEYIGGDQTDKITSNYSRYQNVRTVTLTAPSQGVCFVMASGYVRWESKGWDVLLAGILSDQDPNTSWNAEDEWYSYLNILTDYNCADSSDQYTSFAQHRCIPVSQGTHSFTLWANKYTSSALVRVDDVNLSVLFFPTGGTGEGTVKSASTMLGESKISETEKATSREIDGTIATGRAFKDKENYEISPGNSKKVQSEVEKLISENELLNKRLSAIEKLLIKNKNQIIKPKEVQQATPLKN